MTDLRDIISRARSVITESDGADEHAELIAELVQAEAQAVRLTDFAQTVAMDNTEADRLTVIAAHVLDWHDAPDGDDEDGDEIS